MTWPFTHGDETLSTSEVQHEHVAMAESEFVQIPIAELLIAIIERRRWIAIVAAVGMLLSAGIAFLIPTEFSSTARLMPLDPTAFSNVSGLYPLIGAGHDLSDLGGLGDLLGERSPDSTAIGILGSRQVLDDIINRFNLLRIYHCKLYVDARKTLADKTRLEEDKKTGILSITVEDRDRYRARDIAQAYVDELNGLINRLSTSSARRESEFLETRLKAIKSELDENSLALSQFSSRNATFDIQKQGVATMEAASRLQGELITAESQLAGLQSAYSDDNVRVRAVRARISELQSQLRIMGGIGKDVNNANLGSNELIPSVRQLPILGLTYYNLSRKVETDEMVYEALTKQYEFAKVQEAKDIPVVEVLAPPAVAERKSSPHRSIIIAVGMLLFAFAAAGWTMIAKLWEIADDSSPIKQNGRAILRAATSRTAKPADPR